MSIYRLSLTTLFLLSLALPAYALEQEDDACSIGWIFPQADLPAATSDTQIIGDTLSQPTPDTYLLKGSSQLTKPGVILTSDQLTYNRETQDAEAFGSVKLQDTDILITGTEAKFNQATQQGKVKEASYQITANQSHGTAQSISLDQAARVSKLKKATYTTCPLTDQSWQMHFSNLEINDEKRRIYGHNTWLDFKGVPLFYWPYISLPMDDRANGFLFPYLGRHSSPTQDNSSTIVAVPYYFNIAPNIDDTLTLGFIERRGLLLDNEFRYMSEKHRGDLTLSFIDDQLTKKDGLAYVQGGSVVNEDKLNQRWRAHFNGSQKWGYGITSNINWTEVSDPDLFNDIPFDNFSRTAADSRKISTNSETKIERLAQVKFAQGPIQAHIEHRGYLPLRNGEHNFLEKSPEIGINFQKFWNNFSTNIYLESTEFVRYQGFNNYHSQKYVKALKHDSLPMGQRTLIEPELVYRLDKPYGHLEATVRANYRNYHLKQASSEASDSNTVMQYALKGGLIFERDLNIFNNSFTQTFEPTVQWLYVPYKEQEHLETFDTSRQSLDFSNIFSHNRFSGVDRIGDTKQVSVAVSNKIITQDGRPLADLSVGQIFYQKDRKITLRNDVLDTDKKSDYFGKLAIFGENYFFITNNQFDKKDMKHTSTQNLIKLDINRRFEFLATHQGTNLQNKALKKETIGLGLIWQINSNWQLAHYQNTDLHERVNRERLTGLRYEDCCWAVELIYEKRRRFDNRYSENIQLVFELKGLSSVGRNLRDSIKDTLNF